MKQQSQVSSMSILRDLVVAKWPWKVPLFLLRVLYGPSPDYVFFTHPRYLEDIYQISSPGLRWVLKRLPERLRARMLSLCSTYVCCTMDWPKHGLRGVVISTAVLPQDFMGRRARTLEIITLMTDFIRRITTGRTYVSLSGWWPAATMTGKLFKRVLSEDDRVVVTTGHTATLVSLCWTVERVSRCLGHDLDQTKLAVLGVGNMGSVVATVLNGCVDTLRLMDKNEKKVMILADKLRSVNGASHIETFVVGEDHRDEDIVDVLEGCHVTVCTTLNANHILRDITKLTRTIIIDDSRPEAFERIYDQKNEALVLEGGLIKLDGIEIDWDFGWGKTDSVFGCLAEAVWLALDRERTIKPTLGAIDLDNFAAMQAFCRTQNISEGDLFCARKGIADEELERAFKIQ